MIIRYKYYKSSFLATIISIISSLVMLLAILITFGFFGSIAEHKDILLFGILSIVAWSIGLLLRKCASIVAINAHKKKICKNLRYAKNYVAENPDAHEFCMTHNKKYADDFIANHPTGENKSGCYTMTYTFLFIAVLMIVMPLITKRKKKSKLSEALQNLLKTSEDINLFDAEVYGNLKREVEYDGEKFTFTPHFLINKMDIDSYVIVKLQNVKYITINKMCYKTGHIIERDFWYSFLDKNKNSLGTISTSSLHHEGLEKICREQIPWAQWK